MCPLYRRYTDLSYWRKRCIDEVDDNELFNAVPLFDDVNEVVYNDDDLYLVYDSRNKNNSTRNDSSNSIVITLDSDDEETPDTHNESSTTNYNNKFDDSMNAPGHSRNTIATKRKPRAKKKCNGFILDEASDVDGCLSDEYESTQQELNQDDSIVEFIDDDSEDELTTQSVYLKSLKDIGPPPNRKFKLNYDFDPNIDVYSQAVVEDEEYEMDSFCCDEIVYDDDDDDDDDLMALQISSPNLKSRSAQKSSTPVCKKAGQSKKRYKRVVIESP